MLFGLYILNKIFDIAYGAYSTFSSWQFWLLILLLLFILYLNQIFYAFLFKQRYRGNG